MKIQLTASEQADLRSLAHPPFGQLPTIARYWLTLLPSKGISLPAGRLPMATDLGQGAFTISWTAKLLGPQAIAAGHAFRALHERKDREFAERLRAQGKA